MLNRTKIITSLHDKLSNVFHTYTNEKQLINQLWYYAQNDVHLDSFIASHRTSYPFLLPTWQGLLSTTLLCIPQLLPYRVLAVDGSQIYPDHHQGIICSVINIGSADFYYNNPSTVIFDTEPFIFFKGENKEVGFEEDAINAQRTEFEWKIGLEKMILKKSDCPQLFLCDGSLIFWHLESYETAKRQRFLSSYLTILQQFYEHQQLLAGYISLSQSKELINVLRVVHSKHFTQQKYPEFDHGVDADIVRLFLQPGYRTIIFKNYAPIVEWYPHLLQPHFFYLNTGHEIARIEIPAWIAQDEEKVESVVAIIYDQVLKGQGYPISLAEAHEQAVIKEADRQFFYQMISKLSFSESFSPSLKSFKKRRVNV